MLASSTFPSSSADPLSEVEALRTQIADLTSDVAKLVNLRARQMNRAAGEATSAAREKIGDYPFESMVAAFVVGAVIAVLVSETRPQTRRSRFDSARDDLASYAGDLKRSLSRTASDYSLTDRLDRMVSALSAPDAKQTLAPLFDRVLGWLGQAKGQVKSAAEAASASVTGS